MNPGASRAWTRIGVLAAGAFFLWTAAPALAENYLLNGEQRSRIRYRSVHRVVPASGTRSLTLSYVIPSSFESATSLQQIGPVDLQCVPEPTGRKEERDRHGNRIMELRWEGRLTPVTATLTFNAQTGVRFDGLQTRAPFPLAPLPQELRAYLEPTAQVPSRDPRVAELARKLTAGSRTQFDAVQKILTWIVDHLRYVLTPEKPDALYSLESGRGNCQNYSHLAAALMRASGIPVRIVNGITLKEPYDIRLKDRTLTMKMAQGRHSWIEVYFPDLQWVPFDPQGSELFVSSRFIRVEVGLDNAETIRDGLLRWTELKGAGRQPEFSEEIEGRFDADHVLVSALRADFGPREILLCPRLDAAYTRIAPPPALPVPQKIPADRLKAFSYKTPHVFGNLDFPRGIDFLSGPRPPAADKEGLKVTKSFLVETAEYVTTRGQQYAQMFILDRPLQLKGIGLALHKFNNDGQLWVELLEDQGSTPGKVVAASELISLSDMAYTPGYDWVDFDFSPSKAVLSPGRYWLALGFTGGPIVNWFFSYGKPVGPEDGTRYRTLFDETWSRSLSFEFNYRIQGLTPQ